MKAEALAALNQLIEKKKILKSAIETDLGMPLNSLPSYLSGHKDMPHKWIEPIMQYLEKFPEFKPKPIAEPRTELVVNDSGLKEIPSQDIMKTLKSQWK